MMKSKIDYIMEKYLVGEVSKYRQAEGDEENQGAKKEIEGLRRKQKIILKKIESLKGKNDPASRKSRKNLNTENEKLRDSISAIQHRENERPLSPGEKSRTM